MLDRLVDVHAERPAPFLGQVAEQARRAGQQREPAQQVGGQAEVGQGRAAGARSVQRQSAPEDLRVDPADRLEQAQVRAAGALLLGDADQHRGARVGDLVHRVPEAGDEPVLLARPPHRGQCQGIEGRIVAGRFGRPGEGVGQETAGVLGDAEEPGTTAEQPRGQRSLDRVGRAEVGEPGGDGRRGEAVVGQRDQHGLEHPDLARRWALLCHQPQRQLPETDLAHQVGGEVLAEQGDAVGVRGAQRGGETGRWFGHGLVLPSPPPRHGGGPGGAASQARIWSPCWSRAGGGSG